MTLAARCLSYLPQEWRINIQPIMVVDGYQRLNAVSVSGVDFWPYPYLVVKSFMCMDKKNRVHRRDEPGTALMLSTYLLPTYPRREGYAPRRIETKIH